MTEQKNTLRNTSYARIIEVLGTGEWENVAIGGLKGLYLNDVPVENRAGYKNISGVTLETNTGTITQQPLSIADTTEISYNVGVECTYNNPITHVVTGTDIDVLRVTMSFPQMTSTDVNTGEIKGSKVQYEIAWQSADSSQWHLIPSEDRNWHWDSLSTSAAYYTGYYSYAMTVHVVTAKYYGNTGGVNSIPITVKLQVSYDNITWLDYKTEYVGNDTDLIFTIPATTTEKVYTKVSFTPLSNVTSPSVQASVTVSSVKGHTYTIVSGAANGVQTVDGKCTATYQRQTSFPVSGSAPYTVRVTRLTEDSTSSYITNKSYFQSVSAVTNQKFRYPGFVMAGLYIDASQYNSIPSRGYLCDMSKIKIPSNYDPIARQYSAVWDGTFKTAWSNNPAWVFYDAITNKHQGLGNRIPESVVDKGLLYQIGQYCDELVKTENGSWEPRFTCNVYLQTKQEAYKFISDLATVFRGITYWGLGTVVPVQDSPKTPSYAFTNANVVDGVFNYQGADYSTRYNAVYVTWNDPENYYKQATEYITDDTAIAAMGYVNSTSMAAFGCTSRSQARRVGKWALYTNTYEGEIVSFSIGAEGAIPRPGDVIRISDTLKSKERRGGRILSYEGEPGAYYIELDAPVSVVAGRFYNISTISAEGKLQDCGVVFHEDQTTDIIKIVNSVAPANMSIYTITDETDVPDKQYRVVSVSEKDGKYDLTCVMYDPKKYDYIEKDEARISEGRTTQIVPDSVTSVVGTYSTYTSNGSLISKARFEWSAPNYASSYIVTINAPNGTVYSQEGQDTFYEILSATQGSYRVSVIPKSAFGVAGVEYVQSVSVTMTIATPTGLTLINAISGASQSFNNTDAQFTWNKVPNAIGYYIRVYDINNDLKNTYTVVGNNFTYALNMFKNDGMTSRLFYLSIASFNGDVTSSYTSPIAFVNPPPSFAEATYTVGTSSITGVIGATDSPDYAGTITGSWDNSALAGTMTTLFDGIGSTVIFNKPTTECWIASAYYDTYGKTTLNFGTCYHFVP